MTRMNEEMLRSLRAVLGEPCVKKNEPMSAHTSFRVGGPADLFLQVGSVEELRLVLGILRDSGVPFFILGRGTNLLVGDRGYRGCVITMTGSAPPVTDTGFEDNTPGEDGNANNTCSLRVIRVEGDRIYAGAGASLSAIAQAAKDHGLSGLEFASGIPGSLGGALVMDAGAYEGSMKLVTESVTILGQDGTIRDVSCEDMHFGYRTSLLKETPSIALNAVLKLTPEDPAKISEKMRELNERRKQKQPLEYPSAGSTFKRPEGMFAGKLIMDAGLGGFQIGGAAVSSKHCGFVINKDHASAADIRAVIAAVQEKVLETSGVHLEMEVICLGEF